MRVKVSGVLNMELAGDIVGLKEKDGYLMMNMSSSVGNMKAASVDAALTHRDLMDVIKLLLRPANLCYVLFGFGKPKGEAASPFQ